MLGFSTLSELPLATSGSTTTVLEGAGSSSGAGVASGVTEALWNGVGASAGGATAQAGATSIYAGVGSSSGVSIAGAISETAGVSSATGSASGISTAYGITPRSTDNPAWDVYINTGSACIYPVTLDTALAVQISNLELYFTTQYQSAHPVVYTLDVNIAPAAKDTYIEKALWAIYTAPYADEVSAITSAPHIQVAPRADELQLLSPTY